MGSVGSLASAAFLFHDRSDVSPSGLPTETEVRTRA